MLYFPRRLKKPLHAARIPRLLALCNNTTAERLEDRPVSTVSTLATPYKNNSRNTGNRLQSYVDRSYPGRRRCFCRGSPRCVSRSTIRLLFHANLTPSSYLPLLTALPLFFLVFSGLNMYPGIATNAIEEFKSTLHAVTLTYLLVIVSTFFIRVGRPLLARRLRPGMAVDACPWCRWLVALRVPSARSRAGGVYRP